MKQKQKPPLYRLTLAGSAFNALAMLKEKSPIKIRTFLPRSDGKVDLGISHNTLDQLQTAALPKENLSDTVLRILKPTNA